MQWKGMDEVLGSNCCESTVKQEKKTTEFIKVENGDKYIINNISLEIFCGHVFERRKIKDRKHNRRSAVWFVEEKI